MAPSMGASSPDSSRKRFRRAAASESRDSAFDAPAQVSRPRFSRPTLNPTADATSLQETGISPRQNGCNAMNDDSKTAECHSEIGASYFGYAGTPVSKIASIHVGGWQVTTGSLVWLTYRRSAAGARGSAAT